jgi:putative flippase GtrA
MEQLKRSVLRILRFGLVGVINVAVDWGGFSALVVWFNAVAPLANVVSFSCAVLTSYVLNSRWTFADLRGYGPERNRFGLFVVANFFGLMLSTLLVMVFLQFFEDVVAKMVSIPIVFAYNYVAVRRFVFGAMPLQSE